MQCKLINENFKENWVDNLLLTRGVAADDIRHLKNPTIEQLNEPELLDNIQTAAEMILFYVKQNIKIGLLIDCD